MYNNDSARGLPTSASYEPLSAQQSSPQPVNVLIMNLPFRARWQDLKDLCRQACPIERADVALEVDGRSRGFGEVTCSSRADAERLYAMFNGYEWQNRRLNVIVMDGQSDNANSQGVGPSGPASGSANDFRPAVASLQPQMPTDDKLLFVGNLPFSMQWQDLKDLLRPAGRVQRTDISMAADGRSRGWGTALFYTAEEAQNAVDMFNETEVEGRRMKVRLDRLGGRGVPANRATASTRGGAHSPSSIMQQQHPGSYPLQQNYSASRGFDMSAQRVHGGTEYQQRGNLSGRPTTFGPGIFESESRPGQGQYYQDSQQYQQLIPQQYSQQPQRGEQHTGQQQNQEPQRQQGGPQTPNNNNDYYW